MNDTIIVAGIFALSTVLGPIMLSFINNTTRRTERHEDLERQDEIARRAAATAENVELFTKTFNSSAKDTAEKLDTIHTLVNSSMTAALQSELEATTRELALLRVVVELHRKAGAPRDIEIEGAIVATRAKVAELASKLEDRLKVQATIDARPNQVETVLVVKAPDPTASEDIPQMEEADK